MKTIDTKSKWFIALAVVTLAAGCATQTSKENLAIAAGFKVITPTKAHHQALLAKLPPNQVTQVKYHGKLYYVLPDAAHNQAYVGGPKQYQSYQQLRLAKQLSNQNLMAAELNEDASWGGWGGWGYGWGMGWY